MKQEHCPSQEPDFHLKSLSLFTLVLPSRPPPPSRTPPPLLPLGFCRYRRYPEPSELSHILFSWFNRIIRNERDSV